MPTGKVYSSPIIDCFDETISVLTVGTNPNLDHVNSMLDEYYKILLNGEKTIIHSDRRDHY